MSEAFVLLGGFGVICRNPRYVEELTARGLAVLLLTPESFRADIEARPAGDPIVSALTEIRYVRGAMTHEGSFLPGALAVAQDWRRRYELVGLFAVGEVLVEPAGLVADALGLPSPGLRATRACRSKYLQRWYLPEWSPHSLVLPAGDRDLGALSTLDGPVVVKPAGRHSSSGVRAFADPDSARGAVADYPDGETVLVEERVTGPEFSVESLVQDGRVLFDSVTRKDTTESAAATFVELRHTLPADEPALRTAARDVLRRLDFRDGIAHSEWRVHDGRPVLMEIAARTPGDGLLALYELATGRPLEPEILRVALGEPAAYPAPHRYARQVYLPHPTGTLCDVELDWPGLAPQWVGDAGGWPAVKASEDGGLRAVLVLHDRGAALRPLTESDDRAVTFLLDAPTVAELDELEAQARSAIRIRVEP
jgi:ATP-grasp domain